MNVINFRNLWGKTVTIFLILISVTFSQTDNNKISGDPMNDNISSVTAVDMDGKTIPLSDYSGKVLLIVNVASKCGNTPQYKDLEEIYEKYNSEGFEILAFPCNQFGGQEPGTNEEIKEFCTTNYGVTFKLFDKIDVNGENQSQLYAMLTNNSVTGKKEIPWNFEKFLISRDGKIVARFHYKTKPTNSEVINAIESELAQKG